MAAEIKDKTGVDVALVSGDRGEFTVWVGEEVVARKTAEGFPLPAEVASRVAAAL